MARILIVDDEKTVRNSLREILEFEKYKVEEAKDGEEALQKLYKKNYDITLCDIKMPKMNGIELLSKIIEESINTQVIMISAYASIDIAVEATKKGAFDFIQKPPDLDRLLLLVRNAVDKSDLVRKTSLLEEKIPKITPIIGKSKIIQEVKESINKVAPTEARVLITGPNGSGKELVARWLHEKSLRVKKPLVEVNCAAIPSELIESELFGHERGSFTSAIKQHIGKFEQADQGTLFLDEVGDMSLSAQAKVLRVLQESKITRVGGNKDINVNVRILVATNKDLKQEIKKNKFREDLYHRLNVILIKVPSLNERREDIPILIDKFIKDISEEYRQPRKRITYSAIEKLKKANWSGNVRELRNVIERLIIMSVGTIDEKDIDKYL